MTLSAEIGYAGSRSLIESVPLQGRSERVRGREGTLGNSENKPRGLYFSD